MFRIDRYCLFLALALVIAAFARPDIASADEARRIALVVGISRYDSIYALDNASRDAETVARTLEEIGFEVTLLKDASRSEMVQTIDTFASSADTADAALFYFAGHGFQYGGINRLVPRDAVLDEESAIARQTVSLNDVIAKLEDKRRQTLIFLDACRNNPLPTKFRDGSQGLSQVETGTGTFVAFATQPGNVTRDGSGDHSPFTKAFVDNVTEAGQSISDLMIQVRNDVQKDTLFQQTPWDQSSLRSQFYFVPEDEANAGLTDEDREMLRSLPPDLRAKFESRFGITISSADEETELAYADPEDGSGENVAAPSGATDASAASGGGAVVDADLPAAEKSTSKAAAPGEPISPSREDVAAADNPSGTDTAPDGAIGGSPVIEAPPGPSFTPIEGNILISRADVETPAMPQVPIAPSISILRVEDLVPDGAGQASNAPGQAAQKDPSLLALRTPVDRLDGVVHEAWNRTPQMETRNIALPTPVPSSADMTLGPVGIDGPSLSGREAQTNRTPSADRISPVSVEAERIVGEEVAPQRDETKVASLSPETDRPSVMPAAPRDDDEDSDEVTAQSLGVEEDQMARAVQSELKRLGCYRSTVDNLWGANSTRALLRYYANKQAEPDDTSPTPAILASLREEDEVICKLTRVTPKAETPPVAHVAPSRPKVRVTSRPERIIRRPTIETPAVRRAPTKRVATTDRPQRAAPAIRRTAPQVSSGSSSGGGFQPQSHAARKLPVTLPGSAPGSVLSAGHAATANAPGNPTTKRIWAGLCSDSGAE